jgi:integrase
MGRSSIPVQPRLLRRSYTDGERFTISIRATKAIRIERSCTVCSNGRLWRLAGRAWAWNLRVVWASGSRWWVSERRLADEEVAIILRDRAAAAGVALFRPHDMRRTYISEQLDGGTDLATVQKIVGHESVTTTAGYDRRGNAAKREAADGGTTFPIRS